MKINAFLSGLVLFLPIILASPTNPVLYPRDSGDGNDNGANGGGGWSSGSGNSVGQFGGNGSGSGSGSGSGFANWGQNDGGENEGQGGSGSGSGRGQGGGENGGDNGGQNGGGNGSGSGRGQGQGGWDDNNGGSKGGGEDRGHNRGGDNGKGERKGSGSGRGQSQGGGDNGGQGWGGGGRGGENGGGGLGGKEGGGFGGGDGNGNGNGNGGEEGEGNGGGYVGGYGGGSGSGNGGVYGGGYGGNGGENNGQYDRQNDRRDVEILNWALNLVHMANAFYDCAFSKYNRGDFNQNNNLEEWMYGRYLQIAEHRKIQAEFLKSAVEAAGGQCVQACEYNFSPIENNIWEFVRLSEAIETISASAFNGALRYIENREYTTVMGSILGTESRHAAWINGAVKRKNPWNTAFETPITLSQAHTLVGRYSSNCPSSNQQLLPQNLQCYAQLEIPKHVKAGEFMEINLENAEGAIDRAEDNALFAAFLIGTGTYVQPVHSKEDGENNGRRKYYVKVPEELKNKGAVYIIIVQARISEAQVSGLQIADSNTVAGPALVMISYDSWGNSEGKGYNTYA